MKIIYGVCFYFEKYFITNLETHIKWFKLLVEKYPDYTFEMCIVCMMNDLNEEKRLDRLQKLKSNFESQNIPITYLHDYNSGGTILGFDDCYMHYKNESKDSIILFFEEDFHPTTTDFLEASLKLLPEYSYIGETTTGNLKICNRGHYHGNKTSRVYGSEVEVWTDGGYYCSSIKKLDDIKSILGNFHIGNRNTLYTNGITGITEGEVGFPTRLHYNGRKFAPLYRGTYFVHLNN